MSSDLTGPLKNYLSYLTDTLGLKNILTEAAENSSTYLVLVENLSSYQQPESELLEKMMSALKLTVPVRLLDLSTSELDQNSHIVLKENPEKENETYSPRTLLRHPEFKRKAWDDMKRIFSIP